MENQRPSCNLLFNFFELAEPKRHQLIPVAVFKDHRCFAIGDSLYETLKVIVGVVFINYFDDRTGKNHGKVL
jgi:hypothetical protein